MSRPQPLHGRAYLWQGPVPVAVTADEGRTRFASPSAREEAPRTPGRRQLRTFASRAAGNYALSRALTCVVAENRAGHPAATFPVLWSLAHPPAA